MQLPVKVNARATVTRPAGSHIARGTLAASTSTGRRDRATSMVMEEGGTELEAEAEEGKLEGPVRRTCEDMELEEGDTELEGKLAEKGELVGPAEEGGTELEEGELAGAAELEAALSHSLPPFS